MSVLIECHCGQIYRTDVAQAAFSIRCGNCRRLLKISDYLPKPSKTEPIFVNTELTSGSRSFKNYVVLGIGLVALAIGISLTVANLRNPQEVANGPDQNTNKNEPSASLKNSSAQGVSNSPTVYMRIWSLSVN